uniref:Reverse transcriptase domain-containing protein n=1 Tax=Tanacetum cinerariifolium TaxID=118510 RepID=A0A699H7H0_TANCI|nr:reverse transcriptase domain-containing protein [Tanacetum cinerariifolium]
MAPTQQDGHGSVTGRSRRPPTDRLTFAEGGNSKIQEVSQHYESRTPNVRGEHERGRRLGCSRSMSGSPEPTIVFFKIRRGRSDSPRNRLGVNEERKEAYSIGWEVKERTCSHTRKAATRVPVQEERNPFPKNVTTKERVHGGQKSSPKVKIAEGTLESRLKKPNSSIEEDDLSQPWVCEETDPFTPRIRYFDFPKKTRMPINVKTYDRSEDPKDHLKIFQAAPKVEQWAMPTWCHMVNSTLTGSARGRGSGFQPGAKENTSGMEATRSRAKAKFRQKGRLHEPVKAGKLSRVIKELKQGSGKKQPKAAKKGEASRKNKAMAILMVQPWQKVARQRVTQSFSPDPKISLPPLGDEDETEGPMIIEAEIGGPEAQPFSSTRVTEEKIKVAIHPEYPEQTIAIGSTLTEEGRRELSKHRLNIREGCPPVRQKKRSQAPKRNKAIQEEVERLVKAGIMKEVHYHSWLSNSTGRWNPSVDTHFKCFLDAYKGYHEIKMTKEDEEKTTFITSQRIFCYSKMPFGLKNARESYQLLINKAFQKQIGRDLEVYVDDLVIKSRTKQEIIKDIEETFKTLRKINTKLNPKKCTFRVEEGMFLGYKVNTKGIKVSREAVSAVLMTEREAKQMLIYFVSRALQDFIVERPEDDSLAASMEVEEELLDPWTLFINGSSFVDGSGAELILTNPEGTKFTYALMFRFDATNNETEYEALISSLRIVLVEELNEKSINEAEVLEMVKEEGNTWMTSIYEYLVKETLHAERKKARAVRLKSRRYTVIDRVLYKKSFLEPWTRSVVVKAIRIGYYRPTMHKEARKVIRECQYCQVYRPVSRDPQQKLTPITYPWPFYKWGIDIAGPFLEGPGKVKFLIVAMDYFTKWIEAKHVATITDNQIKKFVWDNIVCRFSLPSEVISNYGKQFRDNTFKDWCENLNICQRFASVKHPQANGLVERASRSLRDGDTPFSLTYEIEAAIPKETGMPTLWKTEVDMVQNDEALKLNLDLLEVKKRNKHQSARQEARQRWKSTITPKSATQASNQEILYTRAMISAMQKTEGSYALSWKDRMK